MIGKKINQLATELAPVSTDLTIIGDPISGVSKKITLAQLGAIFSGAVSFYTDLASFPATGDINVIYCAKDTQKLYLWSGSAYTEVFPSQALLDTYQLRSEKGNANGYASLDSLGKVPISQLPSSIMEYKGTWNAATNTPTLANGTGDTGDVYICNVAGTVNFGAGPITFAVGDYVIYSGTIWQRSSGAVGTVTSVAASITGNSVSISGSPIVTSGTLAFAFAGNATQYVRGDGQLATLPTNGGGGGASVSYYLNGSINQGTIGGVTYYEMNKTPIIGAGTDFSRSSNGYIASFLTDANDPALLNIPAGNFNFETYFQASSGGGSPTFYIELYKYDGTNFTLIASNSGSPKLINDGTNIEAYFSALAVPETTLTLTDRLAVRIYVTTAGRTITLHTENGHLCQVITTFTTGLTALNGLTSQVQYLATGTSGSDFNISSATATHTFNLPTASATNRGALASADWTTFNNKQNALNGTGFVKISGTTISYDNSTYVTIDTFETITASKNFALGLSLGSAGGTNQASVFQNTSSLFSGSAGVNVFGFNSANNIYFGKGSDNGGVLQWSNSTVRYYTLPNATGTIALTSDLTGGTVTSVGLSSATSGVTIGSTPITTSGTITLAIATASGSQQGLLSSTDWTTFNNKQNVLTNPVTGTGTTNYLPKFTGASTIGNSAVTDDGVELRYSGADGIRVQGSTSGFVSIYGTADNYLQFIDAGGATGGIQYNHTSDYMAFKVAGSNRMYLNASGNLGLGVTPNAWFAVHRVMQLGGQFSSTAYAGAFTAQTNDNVINLFNNAYVNSSNAEIYYASAEAAKYVIRRSAHEWYTAPSGTAGNAISFTQAMTLDASGRLGIGTTTLTERLNINGVAKWLPVSSAPTWDTSTYIWMQDGFGTRYDGYQHRFDVGSSRTQALVINTTGAATFSSSVSASSFTDGYITISGAQINRPATVEMQFSGAGDVRFFGNTAYPIRFITGTGAATFSSSVTATTATLSGSSSDRLIMTRTSVGTYHLSISATNRFAIYDPAADSERICITSAGNVGIGTTSPSGKLTVNTGTNENVSVVTGGSGDLRIAALNDAASSTVQLSIQGSPLLFRIAGGVEAMRITSGGSLLVGTTNADIGGGSLGTIIRSNGTVAAAINMSSPANYTSPFAADRMSTAGDGLMYGMWRAGIFQAGIGATSGQDMYFYTGDGFNSSQPIQMTIKRSGNVEIATGSIKTGEPDTGWGRAAIKIGARQSGEAFSSGGYLPVNVDGTVYYINLYSSTP